MSRGEYSSHLPTLRRVLRDFPIKRVLETGSGLYSTAFFLARGVELVSIENNPDWGQPKRPRHDFRLVDGPVWQHLPPLEGFDLIFVDDDPPEEREETLRRVLAAAPALVVAHDADHNKFDEILSGFAQYRDSSRKPHTAVLHPRPNERFEQWLATS